MSVREDIESMRSGVKTMREAAKAIPVDRERAALLQLAARLDARADALESRLKPSPEPGL